jgi:hypothetical protein
MQFKYFKDTIYNNIMKLITIIIKLFNMIMAYKFNDMQTQIRKKAL